MNGDQDTPKDARRRALRKMTKGQLIALCGRLGIVGAYPLGQWSKDDLVAAVMGREFPPEFTQ